MFHQISSNALGKVDLVEQAVIGIPVSYFADRKGIAFERDCDDLDYFDGAFFTLDDNITKFALIHYRGNPENHTALYLDRALQGADLSKIVEHILGSFDIPGGYLTWMNE